MRLNKQEIKKAPPTAGRTFDQQQILRTKDHGPQCPKKLRQLSDGPLVQGEISLLCRPVNLHDVLALLDDARSDEITFLSMPHHLSAAHAAKRAERRKQVDGLEYVGFSLG